MSWWWGRLHVNQQLVVQRVWHESSIEREEIGRLRNLNPHGRALIQFFVSLTKHLVRRGWNSAKIRSRSAEHERHILCPDWWAGLEYKVFVLYVDASFHVNISPVEVRIDTSEDYSETEALIQHRWWDSDVVFRRAVR